MRFIKFSFLFILFSILLIKPLPVWAVPVINVPHFTGEVKYPETAITWFGQVTPSGNYTDVRVGYSNTDLYINTQIFDRLLWYDTNASSPNLQNGDASIIYLQTAGTSPRMFRITAQLNWWEARTNYQKIEEWNGSVWQTKTISFTTESIWRGNEPLDDQDDRGWNMTFHIPFSGLGTGIPIQGTKWKIAVSTVDKDSGNGGVTTTTWPTGAQPTTPSTWSTLSFGMPSYTPVPTGNNKTVTIWHKLNGIQVTDASVGGDTICGDGLDFWGQWGVKNYMGLDRFNIQNQEDVADWPCFNKAYINFPLTGIPAGKEIVSARLTLHMFGNAGNAGEAYSSLIQISKITSLWSESTITWNTAPQAEENISSAWVNPVSAFPGWPGVATDWDVSRGVKDAYTENKPFNIAIYSADSAYHSGKYFVSSDTGDWNEAGRPTLLVTYGDAVGVSPTPMLSADRNNDTKVNSVDFGYVTYAYGSNTGQVRYDPLVDFNGDGTINISDMLYLLLRI